MKMRPTFSTVEYARARFRSSSIRAYSTPTSADMQAISSTRRPHHVSQVPRKSK